MRKNQQRDTALVRRWHQIRESCNTTIKALIKVARGFRNLDNMMALIYLRCSDIVVPLHNRIQPSAEYQRVSLAMATARRRNKEERMQARTA